MSIESSRAATENTKRAASTMNKKQDSERRWRCPWLGLILAAVFLFLISIIYHHPMLRQLGTRLDHLGDPALNAWILKWNLHAIFSDPLGIFNANIFYPYSLSLAFSENLIAPSLLLIPVYFFSDNPVLLHNVSFITGLILSGISGYLLGHYLTRSRLLSLIPAIALSFSPFLQAHHGHLQMHHLYWAPFLILLQYLYFDRLSQRSNRRFLSLAAGAICLAALFLSNGYYFIFTATILPIFQAYRIYRTKRGLRLRATAELAAFWLLAAILVLLFAWPYIELRQSLGLERGIEEVKHFSADIVSFFAYNHGNFWLGNATASRFGLSPEQVLTPGIVLAALFILPLFAGTGTRSRIARMMASYRKLPRYFHIIDAVILLMLIMLIFLLSGHDFVWTSNGEIVKLLGIKMKMTRPGNTVAYLFALILLRIGLAWRGGHLRRIDLQREQSVYLIIALFAFLMALGPAVCCAGQHLARGPYSLLYKFAPGYGGLRVPARFGIIFVFALSIVAMLNLSTLLARMKSSRARVFLSTLIPLLMLLEFYSHPRKPAFEPGEREVDAWMRSAPEGSVLELPLPSYPSDFMGDIVSLYQSSYHWKPIFNGYSGYSPPGYHVVAYYMQPFPSDTAQRILNLLEIDYVILPRQVRYERNELERYFTAEAELKNHFVLSPLAIDVHRDDERSAGAGQTLPPDSWQLESSTVEFSGDSENLHDGDLSTHWHSNSAQKAGDTITLAFGQSRLISGMDLYLGTKTVLFPRGFQLQYVDQDGRWHDLAYHYDPLDFIASIYEDPRKSRMPISFPPTQMRALRLKLTKAARENGFGFAEIKFRSPQS